MDIILGPWIRSHAPELTPENKTDKTADKVEELWPGLRKRKKRERERKKQYQQLVGLMRITYRRIVFGVG